MKIISKVFIPIVLVFMLTACNLPAKSASTPIPELVFPPTSTHTPPPTTTPTPQPLPWSGILSARPPGLQEINQNSLWVVNLVDVTDLHYPGSESFSGKAQKDREYLFPAYWCATDAATLQNNLQDVSIQLLLNGEEIPAESIFTYNYDSNSGWKCLYRSTILSGWKQNIQYVLEFRLTIAKELFDGQSRYAAGTYTHKLIVDAQ